MRVETMNNGILELKVRIAKKEEGLFAVARRQLYFQEEGVRCS